MSTISDHNVEIGADISDFERAMQDMQEQMQGVAEKMSSVGEGMTKGLTAPLAAIGAAGVAMALDTDNSLGRIQAGLGVTAKEAEGLNESAKDLWKNGFGESVTNVADDLVKVKQNLGDVASESDLKEITEQAYILADAFGADIADSSKTAGTMMETFGITGQHAMDLMTVGFQKGGDYSGELLDTLNEYAPMFSQWGMNADEAMALLISGAENGAFSLDKVGDAVKESFLRIANPDENGVNALKELGFNADDFSAKVSAGGEDANKAFGMLTTSLSKVDDAQKRNALGVALFGTQWEDVGGSVVTNLSNSTKALGEVDGAAKKAGDALYDNLGSRLQGVWRQFLDGVEPVGQVLVNLAEKILPPLSAALGTVAKWFGSLPTGVQTTIVIFGVLIAAIGPLLMLFGSITTGISALLPVLAGLRVFLMGTATSVGFLSKALMVLTGPIGIAIAAIIAIGAIIIYLWKTNESFRNGVINIWNQIKAAFIQVWTAIVNFAKPIVAGMVSFINGQMAKLKAFWAKYGNEIKQIAMILWTAISGGIKVQMAIILAVIKTAWILIKTVITVAISAIKMVISVTLSIIIGVVSAFLNLLKGNWRGAFNSIKTMVTSVFGSIISYFQGLGSTFAAAGRGLIDQLVKGITSSAGKALAAVKSVAGKIRDFLPFSPAKVGPLSDLDKLDFGGPITDSIKGALPNVQKMMSGLVTLPGINAASSYMADSSGRPIILQIDGRTMAKGVMPHAVSEIRQKTGMKFS